MGPLDCNSILQPPPKDKSERAPLLIFRVASQRFALPLESVERVVRAVEVTPLPGAPSLVLGAINVAGTVLPVLDVRRRFELPARTVASSDHFMLARTRKRAVVLVIDDAGEVVASRQSEIAACKELAAGMEQFQGVVKLDNGLALIHDLEAFLSMDEACALEQAMTKAAS